MVTLPYFGQGQVDFFWEKNVTSQLKLVFLFPHLQELGDHFSVGVITNDYLDHRGLKSEVIEEIKFLSFGFVKL